MMSITSFWPAPGMALNIEILYPLPKTGGVASQSKESKERLLFDIQTPLAKYDAVFKRLFPETWIFEFSPLLQSLPS
jgi:hypothetical protein